MFARVQTAVNSAVASAIEALSGNETQECTQRILNSIAVSIRNSDVQISGDFLITQKARVALSCAQATIGNDLGLQQSVEEDVVERLVGFFERESVPIDRKQVKEIVNTHLQSALRDCRVEETQGIAVAPTVRITGSKINIGCLDADLERNTAECVASIERGDGFDNDACQFVADCAGKASDLKIVADFDYSDACAGLDRLSIALAVAAIEANSKDGAPDPANEATGFFEENIIAIVAAGLTLLLVIVLIFALIGRKRSRAQTLPQPQFYPQNYYSSY